MDVMDNPNRPTPEQLRIMLQFMETHGDISTPEPGPRGRYTSECLWTELIGLLHSVSGRCPLKDVRQWRRVWAGWKIKTKKKFYINNRVGQGLLGGDIKLKALNLEEQRIILIAGRRPLFRPQPRVARVPRVMSPEISISPARSDSTTTSAIPIDINSVGVENQEVITPTLPVTQEEIRTDVMEPSTSQATNNQSTQGDQHDHHPCSSTSRDQMQINDDGDVRASSPTVTPRQQTASEQRRRRRRSQATGPTSEVGAVERSWLRLERQRLQQDHEREMARLRLEQQRFEREKERDVERLRVETLRVDMENRRTAVLEKISNIGSEMLGCLSVLSQGATNSVRPP